jgi:hypothetical protein
MRTLTCLATLAALVVSPALAQTNFPDLRGTWKGQSESIVSGGGNDHHPGAQQDPPRFSSASFTFTVDKQDGRRLSGTFASPRQTETVLGVISRTGTIFIVDSEGVGYATLLAPDKLEMCYTMAGAKGNVASCTELVKQP